MKTKLQLERRDRNDNYSETILVHIKAFDDGGRCVANARHTPALIQHLTELVLDVPEELLIWRGHNDANPLLAEYPAAQHKKRGLP
jgi:hypothetical protein